MLTQDKRLPVIRSKKVKNRSNRKLRLLLFIFFIIIFVILFINSSFSRIDTIDIRGNQFLTAEEIGQASQIQKGDHFFAVLSKSIERKVKTLEIVESVSVTKKFPGRIIIDVKEYPHVAFQISQDGTKEAILANGLTVPTANLNLVIDKPILTGWEANDPIKIKLSEVLARIPQEQMADISEIKPLPSSAYPDKIKLYTRSYFEVITTVGYLAEKMEYLDHIIADLNSKNINDGELTLLEADTHTPFKSDSETEEAE